MNSFTAHLKPGHEPILVKEGFSWGAFVFGPLWFALHRAWEAAAVQFLLLVALPRVLPVRDGPIVGFGIALLAGLLGRDILRWSLDRRGYTLTEVLAARDEEAALARLLTYQPEIAASMAALLQ